MTLEDIATKWDVVVIGGGISGAGVLREGARLGLRTLLVEQKDFAWGTSSRSSKLIHGGLRYLKEGKFFLTRDSVLERERLLREAPGLVEKIGFFMPIYKNQGPSRFTMHCGLTLYSLLSGGKKHDYYGKKSCLDLLPFIKKQELEGGFHFFDAQVDDSRLVLRVIDEAKGANKEVQALNYTRAKQIKRDRNGAVCGVVVEDTESGISKHIECKVVINATGAWAESVHAPSKNNAHIRPLRGSHIIFPQDLIPIREAIGIIHPDDGRPVFAVPWEGVVLFGTTDVDHEKGLNQEPSITGEEVDYLLKAAQNAFPDLRINKNHCISGMAGIRPVLSKAKIDPSKESREHAIWIDKGLITITGGKLTTFRKLAIETFKKVKKFIPGIQIDEGRIFQNADPLKTNKKLDKAQLRRLAGRYGDAARMIIENASDENLQNIPGTKTLWTEVVYAAKHENIRHLTDLLLRRVRVGLILPEGGKSCLPQIKTLCEPVLNWGEARWKDEIAQYIDHWEKYHMIS